MLTVSHIPRDGWSTHSPQASRMKLCRAEKMVASVRAGTFGAVACEGKEKKQKRPSTPLITCQLFATIPNFIAFTTVYTHHNPKCGEGGMVTTALVCW